MSKQLQNQVAIITDAGKGIGRAIAICFAKYGANIIVADNIPELADDTANAIKSIGGNAIVSVTDITKEESVAEMVNQTIVNFGTIDILVANALIRNRYFVTDLPRTEFQAIIDVNLLGVFCCCKAILPTFYSKKQGNIIIIAPYSTPQDDISNSEYNSGKFAVIDFMKALADEAKNQKVRVNALSPLSIQSNFVKELGEPSDNKDTKADGNNLNDSNLKDSNFITSFVNPEEIADVALFLASNQSRAIHGQAINLNGGFDYC